MNVCTHCGEELGTKDGENLCATCDAKVANGKRLRRNALARARHRAMLDCGLVRVKGALGGVYYE